MDLSTTYLGLTLAHPFMAGASPLADHLDTARRLEDGGASALVLHSLFEEQVTMETRGEIRHRDRHDAQFAAVLAAFPAPEQFVFTVDGYLEQIRLLKSTVRIPVLASLNGTSCEAWMRVAQDIEQAGADALEFNMYDVVSDANRSAMSVETALRDLVLTLKQTVRIPIAIKLSPYYSALGNLARRLDQAGADGLILFNRFYQPDIDLETLSVVPRLDFTSHSELRLRIQWAALLHHRIKASLAVSGGVMTPEDGVKAVLAGANAVQMVSAVLKKGPHCFTEMRVGLARFMDERGFASVADMTGRVSFAQMEEPEEFQRASYIRALQLWSDQQPGVVP
jgi:dihydroorotate dehydrogenase (fumarate)